MLLGHQREMGDEEADVKVYAYEGARAEGTTTEVTAGEENKVLTQTVTLLGAREGEGVATFTNGDLFKGKFSDGVRSGTGVYTYAAPPPGEDEEAKPPVATYEGGFKAGAKSGVGIMNFSGGAKYHGSFNHGKYEGTGTMFYASGDIFTGEWAAGKKHGTGMYLYKASGAKLAGKWLSNILVEGSFVDKFGNTYTGAFASDTGKTTWVPSGVFSLASGAAYTLPVPAAPAWVSQYGVLIHLQVRHLHAHHPCISPQSPCTSSMHLPAISMHIIHASPRNIHASPRNLHAHM